MVTVVMQGEMNAPVNYQIRLVNKDWVPPKNKPTVKILYYQSKRLDYSNSCQLLLGQSLSKNVQIHLAEYK